MISIIMTPYDRDKQLAVTLESIKRQKQDVELVIVPDDRDHSQRTWMNPAPLLNRAWNQTTSDVCIQQNAECYHVGGVIKTLAMVPSGECWFASCAALRSNGSFETWYCHPELNPRPFFFCGAINWIDMLEYNESFTEYGYEDVELADRLRSNGIKFVYLPPGAAMVVHQWHPPFTGNSSSRTLYEGLK